MQKEGCVKMHCVYQWVKDMEISHASSNSYKKQYLIIFLTLWNRFFILSSICLRPLDYTSHQEPNMVSRP